MTLSTINKSEFDTYLDRKSSISNIKKNNSVNESINYYLSKIEDKLNNRRKYLSKNDIINNKQYKKNKYKVPVNINNNYNVNKNHVLITLNNINLEKLKIQKKLAAYNKMMDKKISKLKNNKIKKINICKKKKSSLIIGERKYNINSYIKSLFNNKKLNKTIVLNYSVEDNQNQKSKIESSYANLQMKK